MSLVSFPKGTIEVPRIQNLDKIIHFFFYFVLALLLMRMLKEELFKINRFYKRAIISFVISFGIGILMEFFQKEFTNTRSADIYDVYFNTFGTIIAVIFSKVVRFYL